MISPLLLKVENTNDEEEKGEKTRFMQVPLICWGVSDNQFLLPILFWEGEGGERKIPAREKYVKFHIFSLPPQ